MAITTIDILKQRIKTANKESQIIVLKPIDKKKHKGKLESYFYSTVKGRELETKARHRLVGIFDNTTDKKIINQTLKLAINRVELS